MEAKFTCTIYKYYRQSCKSPPPLLLDHRATGASPRILFTSSCVPDALPSWLRYAVVRHGNGSKRVLVRYLIEKYMAEICGRHGREREILSYQAKGGLLVCLTVPHALAGIGRARDSPLILCTQIPILEFSPSNFFPFLLPFQRCQSWIELGEWESEEVRRYVSNEQEKGCVVRATNKQCDGQTRYRYRYSRREKSGK